MVTRGDMWRGWGRHSKRQHYLNPEAPQKIFGQSLIFSFEAQTGKAAFRGWVRSFGILLATPAWTTDGSADKVANAVMSWARDNYASVYTHWFQPEW